MPIDATAFPLRRRGFDLFISAPWRDAEGQTRTIQYSFTVIQMEIGRDSIGNGTLSYATKIIARHNVVRAGRLRHAAIMLTEIRAERPTH